MMWTYVRPLFPTPPPSPLPARHIASTAVVVQSVSWTVIDAAQSLRDLDLSSAVSPSTRYCGGLNRTSVRKSLQGGKRELVQLTYPTKDSITLHCVPSTLFEPLGRAGVSHHNYPVQISPCTGVMG